LSLDYTMFPFLTCMLVFRMFNFLNVRQLEETLISNKEFGAQYLV